MTMAHFLDTTRVSARQFPITMKPYHPSFLSPIPPSQVTLARVFRRGGPPRRPGVEEPRNERCDRSRHNANRSPLMAMEQYLYLIPLLPLLAFAVNFLFGRYMRTAAHWIAAPAVFASFVLSLFVFRRSRHGRAARQHSSPGSRPAHSTSTSTSTSIS